MIERPVNCARDGAELCEYVQQLPSHVAVQVTDDGMHYIFPYPYGYAGSLLIGTLLLAIACIALVVFPVKRVQRKLDNLERRPNANASND